MKLDQIKIAGIFCGTAIIIGTEYFLYKAHVNNKSFKHKIDILEAMSEYPVEYWDAKKAEAKASIEKYRIDIESKERLTIDKRNRDDQSRRELMAFEKDAPAGYWDYKKHSEEEETKRRQIISEDARAKRLDDRERYITDRNARAMESIANTARMSFNNSII